MQPFSWVLGTPILGFDQILGDRFSGISSFSWDFSLMFSGRCGLEILFFFLQSFLVNDGFSIYRILIFSNSFNCEFNFSIL